MKISKTGNKWYDFVVQGGEIKRKSYICDLIFYANNDHNTFEIKEPKFPWGFNIVWKREQTIDNFNIALGIILG